MTFPHFLATQSHMKLGMQYKMTGPETPFTHRRFFLFVYEPDKVLITSCLCVCHIEELRIIDAVLVCPLLGKSEGPRGRKNKM